MLRQWYAKHDIVNLTVDQSKAGTKTGINRYESKTTAPVVIVKPSKWARRDFYTPSVRNLIWNLNDDDDGQREFSSIERTPFVRNRDIHLSEICMEGREGLDIPVTVGSKIQMTVFRNEVVDRISKRSFSSMMYKIMRRTMYLPSSFQLG